jgi:hypothetical protein
MSVVLRCPTCGTTQGHAGECEACSEGVVRYFCTSHDKGIWLEGPVCSTCGSRFGDARPASRAPRVPIPPAGAPDFRPPTRRRVPEPPPEITEDRARAGRRFEAEVPWAEPRARLPLAGCLVRVVGMVFLLIVVAIIFLLMLFGGFIN